MLGYPRELAMIAEIGLKTNTKFKIINKKIKPMLERIVDDK